MGMEGEIVIVFYGVQPHDEIIHIYKKDNHMISNTCKEIRMHF